MKLQFQAERILAVVAHPDDAELLCAGTLARASADGAAIGLCVLCQGDKGQPHPPLKDLAAVRRREMAAAAELLQAKLYAGEWGDGELTDEPAARGRLMEIVRRFRPTLLLAHDLQDYHPDHRAAGRLAEAVSWFSASPGHVTSSPPLTEPPALWWMDTVNMADFQPEVFIDIGEFVELKRAMLACHQSQLQRGDASDFSPLESLMMHQVTTRGSQSGVAAAEAFRIHRAWKRARAW